MLLADRKIYDESTEYAVVRFVEGHIFSTVWNIFGIDASVQKLVELVEMKGLWEDEVDSVQEVRPRALQAGQRLVGDCQVGLLPAQKTVRQPSGSANGWAHD
ncbi:hypothetical protein ACFQ6Q_17725 [Streptomyces sp. NPDC056437]|uniref:hypothetical protein n=1 Tax=Streptomyces sp. NPDC056437 TaxID=3345816 RepID=UPI0036852505